MHEYSLINTLVHKISAIALEQHASKVTDVTIKLGALSHISPEHFREHFIHVSRGTVAEGSRLHTEVLTDVTDPHAQEILLESIAVDK